MKKTNLSLLTILVMSGIAPKVYANSEMKADAEKIAALSSETSVAEMAAAYRVRIADFHNAMMKPNKLAAMNNYLAYAKSEIDNQTGGSGIIHATLMAGLEVVRNHAASGNTQAAVEFINATVDTVLRVLE